MENAAKALLIAGGILLALLIASLLVLLVTNIDALNNADSAKQAAEQLAAFNKQYESYNKKLLYGTDVITLVNKAIENNRKMGEIVDVNSRYYVNVIINTNQTYSTEIKKYKVYNGTETLENIFKAENLPAEDQKRIEARGRRNLTLENINENPIELGKWDTTDQLRMKYGVVDFFNQDAKDSVLKYADFKYYIYSALNVFKKAIFKCEKVEYLDGRVHSITFTEIETQTI